MYKYNSSKLIKLPNSAGKLLNLLWFKYNIPIRINIDEFTNIRKAFIFGFGLFQTIIQDDLTNSYYDINDINKSFNIASDSLTSKSEMMVYLFRDTLKNELSGIIHSDLDELVECNLYNYNPLHIVSMSNIDPSNRIFQKLLNKFNQIHLNKSKYISYLKINNYNHPKFEKLHTYQNNYINYLINLWSSETKSNIYFNNDNLSNKDTFNKLRITNQTGGKLDLLIDDILKYLKINNISKKKFLKNQHF